ncbi:peptide ABC transporter substrate-binding protein [Brevibacterium sediminis]|uniref:Peptide ABC transporter substrate-binding protein n=1 Tax=Brevibacterium sediminis TaxID=1857024 RepID=A0ABQ1N255_9MICO|nr:ABC transporter family substrate-binding protein [Brevibacterium sediminis]GGC48820.1 peptide ABC transporter substrate-binding protein [Brevibacterium sediminis]
MKKHFIAGSLAAATAIVMTGCTPPGGGDSSGGKGAVLNIGWNEAFRSMNDMTMDGNAVANTIVAYMSNDNFKYYDDDLELHDGALGEVEKVSDDPLKVRYTFGEDANWSDGTPVDAADLALTWAARSQHFNTVDDNRDDDGTLKDNPDGTVFFDSSAVGAPLIDDFPEISEDGKSLTFTYSKPFADWETEFGLGAYGSGVPAHIVAKNALGTTDPQEGKAAILDAIESNDKNALSKISNFWNTGFDFTSMPENKDLLVHNGPYEITDFEEGQYLTLSRDEDYTGSVEPKVDTVTIRYNGDPMAMVQAIENGEVDLTQPQSTADVLSAAEKLEDVSILPGEDATFEHVDLTFDNNGPFDPASYGGDEDAALKVRQAFLKTLPRQEIIDRLIKPLNEEAEVRDSFNQAPDSPLYDDIVAESGISDYDEVDIDGAKKLLDEAGAQGPSVRFLYDNTNARRSQLFALIKESAEKAGFKVEDAGDVNWGTRLGDGTYDASLFGWALSTTAVTESDSYYRKGALNNYSGYDNKDLTKTLDEMLVTIDPDKQASLAGDVEQQLVDDAFGLPLFQHPSLTIHGDKVSNVSTTTLDPSMFWNFWEWETK